MFRGIVDHHRTSYGNLSADGLHEQQLSIERAEKEQRQLMQAREHARQRYGDCFEICGASKVEFHPSQNCDMDGVRS